MPEPVTASLANIIKAVIDQGKLMVFGATIAFGSAAFLFVPGLRGLIHAGWTVPAWVGLVFGGSLFAAALTEVGARAFTQHIAAERARKSTTGLEITARGDQSYWTWMPEMKRCELHLDLNAFNRGQQTLHVVEARVVVPRTKPIDYLGRVVMVKDPIQARSHPDTPVRGHSTRTVMAHITLSRPLGDVSEPLAAKVGLRTQDGVEHIGSIRLRWVDPPRTSVPGEYGYTSA